MVDHEAIQGYLDLSRDFLRAAGSALADRNLAPAYHAALHAVELGVKANDDVAFIAHFLNVDLPRLLEAPR